MIEIAKIWQFIQTKAGQQLLYAFGFVLLTVIGGASFFITMAYHYGKDTGEKNLIVRQDIMNLDLPKLSTDSKAATVELRDTIKELTSLTGAKKRAEELEGVNKRLIEEARAAAAAKEAHDKKLADVENQLRATQVRLEPYITKENNRRIDHDAGAYFFDNRVAVGYASENHIRKIFVNGKPHPATAGVPIMAEATGDATCIVRPNKVDTFYIEINVRCD